MSQLQNTPCETHPADEQTPDGLRGTPAARFTEAVRRVFSLTPAQVADVKQATKPKPAPAKQARQKTA